MSEWTVGKEAWVLNGKRSRAFLVRIFAVDEDTITVVNEDKDDTILVFDDEGYPVTEMEFVNDPPRLVPFEDALAQQLESERINREFGERLHVAGNTYRDSATPENLAALVGIVKDWNQFNVEQGA